MLKNLLFKQLLKSKMKDIPQVEQEKIFEALDSNPKLFEEIALRAQEKIKSGTGQMEAIMESAREREAELKNALNKSR